MAKGLLSCLYRWLRHFGQWHERHEVYIALLEGSVALTGSILFFVHLLHVSEMRELLEREFLIGSVECIILVILALSLLARAALLVRRRGLGPKLDIEQDEELLLKLTQMKPDGPFLGRHLGSDAREAGGVIEALARESASTYSIRTLGEPDRWWAYWEAAYIAEWHAAWPETIWRIPPNADPDAACAGYFSVILPITDQSYSRYRRGHLHAAMSTLDIRPPQRIATSDAPDYVNLLAYSALYVPAAGSNEPWNRTLLIYAALEHLAALLARCWPDLLDPAPRRGLRIICESSNRSLDETLEQLGFQAILSEQNAPEEEGGKEKASKPLKSPVGFRLYEIQYHPAIAAEDAANERGRLFLESLRRIACLPAPTKQGRGGKASGRRRPQ